MFCFVGFGTDRLRREEAMRTSGRENPNHGVTVPRNREHGAAGQNRSCSIKWAAKQEKFRPRERCFFLTSTFIELLSFRRSKMSPRVPASSPDSKLILAFVLSQARPCEAAQLSSLNAAARLATFL